MIEYGQLNNMMDYSMLIGNPVFPIIPQDRVQWLFPFGLWLIFVIVSHPPMVEYLAAVSASYPAPAGSIAQGLYYAGLLIAFLWIIPQLPKPGVKGHALIVIAVCAVVIVDASGTQGLVDARAWMLETVPPDSPRFWWMVACYVAILAIPFVPGVELGLLLMLVYGQPGIIAVYLATIIGLVIPFLLGRLVPRGLVSSCIKGPLCNMTSARLPGLQGTRDRGILLGLAFNLPGNSIIGGGGAIALLAGINRYVSLVTYILVVALATLPVPLLTWFGLLNIEALIPAGL